MFPTVVHRESLFWRIYRYGLLALGIAALVLLVGFAIEQYRPPISLVSGEQLEYFSTLLDEPSTLNRTLEDFAQSTRTQASVYSWDGKLLASSGEPPAPPLLPAERNRLRLGEQSASVSYVAPLSRDSKRVAYVVLQPRDPDIRTGEAGRSIAVIRWASLLIVVLGVVAVGTIPIARAITAPLEELTRAVRAFGEGDLSVRSGIRRKDEVGQLATTFDQMASRLERLLNSEKELLANVSHELRTPIQRLRLALELAEEGDAERARQHLADMGNDLSELEQLVSDILITARLENEAVPLGGIPRLQLKPTAPSQLLEESAARFRLAHPDRKLKTDLAPRLPKILADPVLLRSVVDNILDNARKYSDSGEEICLVARPEEKFVKIEVRDRGIGMDTEDLRKAFTPFFRTDRSRARGTGGVGLGLALARRVAEAHGGSLVLESMVGLGTVARLLVPVVDEA